MCVCLCVGCKQTTPWKLEKLNIQIIYLFIISHSRLKRDKEGKSERGKQKDFQMAMRKKKKLHKFQAIQYFN